MTDVGFFEAWSVWTQGKTDHLTMWGHTMLFWGRAGKIAQFIGALAVVAEIIGPERLRGFGTALRSAAGKRSIHRWFFSKVEQQQPSQGTEGEGKGSWISTLFPGSVFLLAAYLSYKIVSWKFASPNMENRFIQMLVMLSLVVLAVVLALVLFILIFITCLSVIKGVSLAAERAIRAIAWILERPKLERAVKVASVLLLVIGFHFDLLAT